MALVSPGVELTIIDQSQYLPAAPASVPLIVLATAQNKTNASGTGIAPGTTAANANKLYRITSQRDLVSYFGNPFFYKTTNGTPIQGYELNEYGLLAAYSVLGSTNLCYVIRANIDLASLIGRTGRPSAPPLDGSYWLNSSTSSWGIFEFNSNTGNFTYKDPIVITDSKDIDSAAGQPNQFIGNIGDYAINLTDIIGAPNSYYTYWFKNSENVWVSVGGLDWRNSWPSIQGSPAVPPATLTAGNLVLGARLGSVTNPGISVAVPAAPNNTVAGLAAAINTAAIYGITAKAVNNKIQLFSSLADAIIVDASSTPALLSDLGIQAKTYYATQIQYGTNAQQPTWRSTDATPRPTGSVWIKTNAANLGMLFNVGQYSAATATYVSKNVTTATSDWDVINQLDATGGKAIPANSVYAQYFFDAQARQAPVQLFRRTSAGAATFIGTTTTPTFNVSTEMLVYVSTPGNANLAGPYVVTMPSTGPLGAAAFVTAWTAANIPNTTAEIATTGAIVLTHTAGGVIVLDDLGNTGAASIPTAAGFIINDPSQPVQGTIGAKWGPYKNIRFQGLATTGGTGLGLTVNSASLGYIPAFTVAAGGAGYVVGDVVTVTGGNPLTSPWQARVTAVNAGAVTALAWTSGYSSPEYTVQLSNWQIFEYVNNEIAPVQYPANNTNWFYSVVNQVDIMTNVAGEWKGYRNVSYANNGLPQITGTPATDPAGPIISASQPTAQSDGTPLVYGDLWIDTSDLENYPVISRWQEVSGVDQWVLINNTDQTTENGILFADARWATNGTVNPIDDAIPSIASLLVSNYLDLDAPAANLYPQGTLLFNTRRSGYNVKQFRTNYFNLTSFPDATLPQETDAWVTVSGNMTNGAPYMGRKAQRSMVVQALKTTVDTNTDIREEDTFFNLMACPNYCELQPNMVTLNNDRGETSYIIGDTPLRLAADANDIFAWATNAAGSTGTSEEGLVTRNTYMGIYYPSGITTDLTGAEVVVPPSHMMLRTIIYNDSVAYPWFAPAGQRRGIISNASNIGYIDAATGEFITTKNRVGLRNVEYTNFINPIAYFTNIGLLNYGNKNSFDSSSALDRTNVARLVNYLRDRLAKAVAPFLFEPNDALTRNQVSAICQTFLADIMAKRGLYDYLVVCDETNNTPARIDRNELWIDIAIEPVKAIEFIYIPIRILNTGEIAGLGLNG